MSTSRRKIVQFLLCLTTLLCLCVTVLLVIPMKPRFNVEKLSTNIAISRPTAAIPVVHHCKSPWTKSEKGPSHGGSDFSGLSTISSKGQSKELVVHRAYFDHRRRSGYCNTTVFLVETKNKERMGYESTFFEGCRVGIYASDQVLYRTAVSKSFFKTHPKSNLGLVDCYDVGAIENGDSAALFYKSSSGLIQEIEALRFMIFPETRGALKSFTDTVVVCAGMVHSSAISANRHKMLSRWLLYQKVIGVDHVHLALRDSFVKKGGLKHDVIQEAIRNGFLTFELWSNWLTADEVQSISQSLAYQDCLYRFQDIYDYIIFAESDDFFVPVKKKKSIKYYLKKWCPEGTGTCQFQWIQFFPDCGWDPMHIGVGGNFTKSVTYKNTIELPVHRFAYRSKALVEVGIDFSSVILDGYVQTQVPKSVAYFAHMAPGQPHGEKC